MHKIDFSPSAVILSGSQLCCHWNGVFDDDATNCGYETIVSKRDFFVIVAKKHRTSLCLDVKGLPANQLGIVSAVDIAREPRAGCLSFDRS
jgi:hypothetical protein